MKAGTHLAFAALIGVVATGFHAELSLASGAALALGSLLPDIDSPQSFIGGVFKAGSKWLERKFGHRTLTHSLLGMVLLALGSSFLLLFSFQVWLWLLLGYLSHLLLDTANVMGVPLVWPSRLQFWLVHNRAWRVPYGSEKETIWLLSLILLTLILTPLAFDGFSPWFHRFLGTTYGAVEDYLHWHEDYDVWVELKGVNLLTGEQVRGRYKAIDTLSKERLLVEDEGGKAYEVSHGVGAQLWPRRITAWRGEAIETKLSRLELAGQSVASFIDALPTEGKVYVTAELELDSAIDLAPELGSFERIRGSGTSYTLRAARPAALEVLRPFFIERGSAVVRVESKLEGVREIRLEPSGKVYDIELDLPAEDMLLLKEGDLIQKGESLAKLEKSLEQLRLENDLMNARAKVFLLQEQLDFEAGEFSRKQDELIAKEKSLEKELERLTYLITEHAEPQNKLESLGLELEHFGNELAAKQKDWNYKEQALSHDIETEMGLIAELEMQLAKEQNRLEPRAPVGGKVLQIRLSNVSPHGVTVLLKIEAEN